MANWMDFYDRENERKRISAVFPERPLARGGYRPPQVTLQRPRNVSREKTIDEITRGWAESKAREKEQGIAPRVSVANATNIKPWIQPEIMRREPFGMSRLTEEPYSGPSPTENLPSPDQTAYDAAVSKLIVAQAQEPKVPTDTETPLRLPERFTESARKEPFLDYPKTAAPNTEILHGKHPTATAKKLGFLEGLDEDTRRNLMLSALTMGLKLMSSQKWSREPQSPVADIGEAGLTGVQTYVGLASADRREKHLEAEMKRKALANKLTGEYREKRLGLEERRVGLQEGEKIQTVSQPFESGGLMYKTITYSSGRTDTKLLTQGENLEPLKGERKGFAPQAQSLVHPKTNERKWFDMNTKEGIEAAQKEGFIPYAKPEEPKAPTLNYEYKNIEGVPHQRQQEWDSKTRQWISKGDWIRREKPPAEKESKSKENKWLGNFGKRYAVTNIYGESLLTKESAIAAWEDFRKQIPTLQKQGYDIDHLTTQMRSLYGEEEAPKPAQEQMPPASQHKGRIIKDTISGKRHKSDGTKWIEVK